MIDEPLLREIASRWFDHPFREESYEREQQYQAFRARLMLELRAEGYSNQGAVSAHLELSHSASPWAKP